MISLVICTITPKKLQAVLGMFRTALGQEPWELHGVHHPRSIAEGYNQVVPRLRGDIVIFCHDDIIVLNPDFPQRLKEHLRRFDIVGVAGTRRMVDTAWFHAGNPHVFGQLVQVHANGTAALHVHDAPQPAIDNIQAIDGVFMAMRRSVLDKVTFDQATFDGFHHYDLDFCLSAIQAGFRIGVACDINLLHLSGGSYGPDWEKYANRFRQKWAGHIGPISEKKPCIGRVFKVESPQHAVQLMNPPHWLAGEQKSDGAKQG